MNFNILVGMTSFGSLIANPTAADGFPIDRLFKGDRTETFKTASASTSITFDWDFGDVFALNALYIGRANLISLASGGNVTANIKAADNDAFTSPVLNESLIFNASTGSNLGGVNNEDFLLTFAAEERYWRVTITAGSSIVFQFSKLILAIKTDMSKEPSTPIVTKIREETRNCRRQTRITSFNFSGITDNKLTELFSLLFVLNETFPVILSTPDYGYIIENNSFKYGLIKNIKTETVTINSSKISFDFLEAV